MKLKSRTLREYMKKGNDWQKSESERFFLGLDDQGLSNEYLMIVWHQQSNKVVKMNKKWEIEKYLCITDIGISCHQWEKIINSSWKN